VRTARSSTRAMPMLCPEGALCPSSSALPLRMPQPKRSRRSTRTSTGSPSTAKEPAEFRPGMSLPADTSPSRSPHFLVANPANPLAPPSSSSRPRQPSLRSPSLGRRRSRFDGTRGTHLAPAVLVRSPGSVAVPPTSQIGDGQLDLGGAANRMRRCGSDCPALRCSVSVNSQVAAGHSQRTSSQRLRCYAGITAWCMPTSALIKSSAHCLPVRQLSSAGQRSPSGEMGFRSDGRPPCFFYSSPARMTRTRLSSGTRPLRADLITTSRTATPNRARWWWRGNSCQASRLR
jgi:hypothetical protein